ncbi:MAG: DUF59 domain-containing protein [gamma proteobacterium endosymbiont of Lamellibrachia anaximandri]|nr:DUF59 domain-containing protein [gamma proteobacterium endosymbiont of Lamellibrachia anaximandri]
MFRLADFAKRIKPQTEATDTLQERSDTGTSLNQIIVALRTVFDPEIPVNVYDLGLIYRIDINRPGWVSIEMTLTSPSCPVAEILPGMVETAVRSVESVREVDIKLVWEPPWSKEQISDEAKLQLGLL